MDKLSFGKYLQAKRIEKGKSLRRFAEEVGIAAPYLSEIENGTRPAPEKDVLDRIVKALSITVEDQRYLYDLVAEEKGGIAQDIPQYIKENEIVIRALRTAKDAGAGIEEWERFIEEMEAKNKGSK